MKGARFVGRGLADTYENLVYFTLLTLIWWVCLISIVLAPSATLALFTHADPRIGTVSDRPSLSETFGFILRNIWRGWRLALLTVPILLLLSYNIGYYGTQTSAIGILSPLWFFLFVIAVMITVSAFSIQALREEESTITAGKLATVVVGAHLFHAILMIILTVAVGLLFGVLIIPFILFFPATVAAIFNRFVLSGFRVPIPNPLAPTPERAAEGKEKRRKWWGP
jgi:uncharacterized membrane protein YesL